MNLKCGILTLILLFCSYYNLYSLSVSPSIGLSFENGNMQEFVDSGEVAVSKLNWGKLLVGRMEAGLDIELGGFFFDTFLKMSVPNGWSSMEDYDYRNGKAIRYSRHENHLDKDLSILMSIGYKFRTERLSIFPSLGCKYSNTKHSAWSGYIQEAIEGDALAGEEEKQRVTGNGVSYEQQVIIPFVDLDIGYDVGKEMAIGINLGYCPYVYADCLDSHYVRTKQFYDRIRGGYAISASIWFTCNKYIFSLACEHIKSSKNSQTFQSPIGVGYPSDLPVGGYVPGFKSDTFSLTARYCF